MVKFLPRGSIKPMKATIVTTGFNREARTPQNNLSQLITSFNMHDNLIVGDLAVTRFLLSPARSLELFVALESAIASEMNKIG